MFMKYETPGDEQWMDIHIYIVCKKTERCWRGGGDLFDARFMVIIEVMYMKNRFADVCV